MVSMIMLFGFIVTKFRPIREKWPISPQIFRSKDEHFEKSLGRPCGEKNSLSDRISNLAVAGLFTRKGCRKMCHPCSLNWQKG